MQMLKKYIKSILLENKFDNIEFSADLVDIMLDELLETEKALHYKDILIYPYYKESYLHIKFFNKREPYTSISQPKLKLLNTKMEDFKENFYLQFKNLIYYNEFDKMFEKFAKQFKLRSTFNGSVFVGIISNTPFTIFSTTQQIEFIKYQDWFGSPIKTREKDPAIFRNPIDIMNEVQERMKEALN